MAALDTGDLVAVVALVISIIAFGATMMQVAQQYYSSAAGYSNCGEQVMGEWSKSKRRKFHYDELRFEVQFEAPVIFVCGPKNDKGPVPDRPINFVKGTPESLKDTRMLSAAQEWEKMDGLSKNARIHTADNGKASWVTMLQALHAMERDSQEWQEEVLKAEINGSGPKAQPLPTLATWQDHSATVALQPKLRSWDTMPSEVKKPYATTTICHLVEMCALLGLHWKEFDRSQNKYRADGNGFLLTGHDATDLGLMFNFQTYGKILFKQNRVMPVDEIKELAFGCVPTIYRKPVDTRRLDFDSEDPKNVMQLGSVLELSETLIHFGCNTKTASYFRNEHKKHAHLFPIPFEILGMLSRPLYIPNTYFRVLPNPTTYQWNKKNFSLRKLLLEFNRAVMNDDITAQNDHISKLQNWGGKVEGILEKQKGEDQFPIALLDELHKALLKCDEYLTEEVNHNLVILVVREHVQEVMRLLNEDPSSLEVSTMDDSDSSTAGGGPTRWTRDNRNSRETPKFDELNSAGPEEKQAKFMDIYFTAVLPNVMRNSHEVLRKKKSTHYVHSPKRSSSSSMIDLTTLTSSGEGGDKPHFNMNINVMNANTNTAPNVNGNATHLSPQQSLYNEKSEADIVYSGTLPTTPHLSVSLPDEDLQAKLKRMDTGLHDERTLNIWCTLVFRMLCWLLLHDFHKKDVQISTKSELYGSRLPVYIA